jgi:dienelactone hydrolase
MTNNRRDAIKLIALSAIGVAGTGFSKHQNSQMGPEQIAGGNLPVANAGGAQTMIGVYGEPLVKMKDKRLPTLSFRNKNFTDINKWRPRARQAVFERIAMPDAGPMPKVTIRKQYEFDGLHIEELTWQLPYGPPTDAILLKPIDASGPLPGILAFHDHGGNKYFGTRKITRTSDQQHPLMVEHQAEYYSGRAWANEVAKTGYVVLVSDAFTFGSRRVLTEDVPKNISGGLNDSDPENAEHIKAYNDWAANHEHIMAKSLFCAGTTWPGMFLAEDMKALDILCARKDVDPARVGCAGLSGGGTRTGYMGGLDPRIKCAVCVGFMTTWNDFVLHKSFTHTWMIYAPILPKELDYPEILGLRAPLPTLVLNDIEDELFTLSEMKEADKILGAVYEKSGQPDHFKSSYYPGVHKFDVEMQKEAFAWFDKWLKS